MRDGDMIWIENLDLVFVEDSNVATVTGLSDREKRHVNARNAMG